MKSSLAIERPADYATGVKLLQERKFEAALGEFKGVVSDNPDHAEAQYQIARLVMAANRAWRALDPISKAIAIKPKAVVLWQAWAEAVALGGNADDEKEFLSALKTAPINAKLKIQLQDRFGALRSSSRPATGGVNKKQVQQLLAAMGANNFATAEKMATKLFSAFPKSALAANILAVAQANLGKHGEAHSNYLKAIKLDPLYAEAYDNLARFLLARDQKDEAANYFRKAVTLAPGMLSALVGLGNALRSMDEHRAAVIIFERAVKEAPGDAIAHLELANAYVKTNRSEEAEVEFEKARELSSDDISPDHRVALAQMQGKHGRDEAALENFERVLDEHPDFPPALSGKASILQSLGRFDEARDLFRLATTLAPKSGENFRLFLASHKAKKDDPIIAEMLEIYERDDLTDHSRFNMAFAIAKALEDSGDYSRVFEFLNEANRLVRKSDPYLIEKRFTEIDWFRTAYSDYEFSKADLDSACETAPIFVTGMPRSGTTLVEQIIASHSTIFSGGELGKGSTLCHKMVASGKSARPLSDVSREELTRIGIQYTDYINQRFPDAARITDKSITSYMHIGPLKLTMPNARFIVVRRDPRDNLLSMYKNKFPEGTHPYAYDQEDLARYYGTFVDTVEFWRERVPDWFYEVQYEDLVANPEEEARKLIAACGLEWEDDCLNFHNNKNKVQTLSLYQVRQPISQASVKGWRRFEADLEPMLKILREDGHVTD